MKGRKPKADAIRRGGRNPLHVAAEPVEARTLQAPPLVAGNPTMLACWELIVGDSPIFQPSDIPQLEAYCYWYAVLQQCEQQTITADGRVVTMFARKDADGRNDPNSIRANPDIRTAEKATAMLRLLGGELNLTPTGRARAGLVEAMTRSTQADVIKKTAEGLARFKEQQRAAQ